MPQGQSLSLLEQAEQIAGDFDLPPDQIRRVAKHFVGQLSDGLAHARPWQLPAYVTSIPQGTEKGEFLAIDLGGSNCRICLVNLKGNSTFDVSQTKHSIPSSVMVCSSYRPLFDFIADKLNEFLETRTLVASQLPYSLGFTFSFTCEQTSLASGRLIHWDKGWDIPDALGRDPCIMLQEAIDKRSLPVRVTALANDSVGTLLTRSYVSGPKTSTLAAMIFGTGTNAAYVEKLSNVRRLPTTAARGDIMVMNTEWGCLDDQLQVLPRTAFDDELDAASTDPGSQMLEKRVSGLYLGELLRLAIVQLHRLGVFTMQIDENSICFQRGGIDSSFISRLAATGQNERAISLVGELLSARHTTADDARAILLISNSIARRGARLAGASLAALIIQSGRLQTLHDQLGLLTSKEPQQVTIETCSRSSVQRFWQSLGVLWQRLLKFVGMSPAAGNPRDCALPGQGSCAEETIDLGADGSLFEHNSSFENEMRAALREVPQIGAAGEQRVRIRLTRDGSGVGAALMAQAAGQGGTNGREAG
ncbi:putative glucokinase [Aspergillus heterothallicus]